ncbi:hypothetical protein CEH05_07590 [Halobacillus halophilus]|uniref:Uncharacterized protein n=1 Tax=Halobacillus halophilus (strain ATCC 35676 / DSM 2266 / JCM 20832 / KCTC 3685 / LMG 17431 / NBRC 102448 / NCIMB 2269) TaxID=866895 RepID=I0JL37_HALH3|nr:hypothetical protein CEH05_07590 [Halobacillus halophilus]CCG44857.1 hypothetical protein HBHAL_2512 [Halobacillus halophilus DSM 2266]
MGMGYVLLTGVILLAISLITIKKFKTETSLQKILHLSALLIGVVLIILSTIGIIGYGQDILNY